MGTWENQLRSMEVEGNNDKHIGRLSVLGSAKAFARARMTHAVNRLA